MLRKFINGGSTLSYILRGTTLLEETLWPPGDCGSGIAIGIGWSARVIVELVDWYGLKLFLGVTLASADIDDVADTVVDQVVTLRRHCGMEGSLLGQWTEEG